MKGKNRFSKLLSYLMEVSELKNYTLANHLQYDVSYISKWINGQMLPGSKTEKTVLQGISSCIVKHGSDSGLKKLYDEYLVSMEQDLEGAIYDHLMAEYCYVKNLQQTDENTVAPKTMFFPKLDMRQYIDRMNHPVLRRVKSLEIMAMMDLMAMDREYRMQITRIDNRASEADWHYPNVHFSMIIDLDTIRKDRVYDVVFLLNMLTDMTHVDFRLYGAHQAYGRAIFTVKDEYAISAMLMQSQTTMSVVVSEDQTAIGAMYQFLESLCARERLLVRQCSMQELLQGNDYARGLIAPNQRLLFGHMTEHFLPDEVFEAIMAQQTGMIGEAQIRWFHGLSKRRVQEIPMRILFWDTAFSEFAVQGELDFYNIRVKLTPSQRMQYVCGIRDMIGKYENLSVRLIYGKLFSDFQYHADQCLFLNDAVSYLTLGEKKVNNIYVVNSPQMKHVFEQFFDDVWDHYEDVVISDRGVILTFLDHIIHQISIILQLEDGENEDVDI